MVSLTVIVFSDKFTEASLMYIASPLVAAFDAKLFEEMLTADSVFT